MASNEEFLEIRVHGRGGQGGVTCAKLVAAVHAATGRYVQTFGDYGSERSGAPVRAFTRVGASPIRARNKVYRPHHLIVFDRALLGPDVLDGVPSGGILLLNASDAPEALSAETAFLTAATVDATGIARRHGIGTQAVVIINTTIVGAYVRLLGLPWETLEAAYRKLGLARDLAAAREAYETVRVRPPAEGATPPPPRPAAPAAVLPLTEYRAPVPSTLKTGGWRSQSPEFSPATPPCVDACPAGNDVEAFLRALECEGVEAAAAILLSTQPLPSVCGRVCPGFCRAACNRAAFDGAVNVPALERRIGDLSTLPIQAAGSLALRVAVAGAGPAGISAAWALARAGCRVTVWDKGEKPGGLLQSGIPAYRLPPEALERDLARVTALGVDWRPNETVDAARLAALSKEFDAVIWAVGLGAPRRLGAEGETLEGVAQGLEFLAAAKRGGAPALSGRVLVAGGGNTAVDCARTAVRLGADSVAVVYRRGPDEMGASAEEIAQAREEGVEFLFHRLPVAFEGDQRLSGAVLAEVEPGPLDASGRHAPVVTQRTARHACDHVFLALGQSALGIDPAWTLRDGRFFEGQTPLAVWAAGDCATGAGTVAHAVGDGRRVAHRLLEALAGVKAEPPPTAAPVVASERMRFDRFPLVKPHPVAHLDPVRRKSTFEEVSRGLKDDAEAARCLHCGRCTGCDTCLLYCPEGVVARLPEGYAYDPDYCKGCGLCAAECPRGAVSMRPLDEAGGAS